MLIKRGSKAKLLFILRKKLLEIIFQKFSRRFFQKFSRRSTVLLANSKDIELLKITGPLSKFRHSLPHMSHVC